MPLLNSVSPSLRRALVVAWALALAGLVAFAAYAIGGLGRGSVDSLFDTWVNSGVSFVAAGICLARALRFRGERRAWLMLCAGIVLTAIGDVLYNTMYADVENPPFPSICDVFYLAFYPCVYAGLMMLVRSRAQRFNASIWLDGLIGGFGVAAIGAALVFQPIYETSTGSLGAVATNLAYPLADLLLLGIVVAMFALRGWRPGAAWLLLGAGLAVDAVADSGFLYEVAKGTYRAGHWLDLLWPLCYVLIAAAAWQRPRTGEVSFRGWRMIAVPTGFAASSLGLFVLDHFHRVDTLTLGAALAALLAACARVGFTFKELRSLSETRHQALTDDLTGLANRRALNAHLATRIDYAGSQRTSLGLVVFSLDRFKELNDTLGHQAGDALLQQIEPRVEDALGGDDALLARMEGPEFALVLPGERDDVLRTVAALRAALERPFDLHDTSVLVEAAAGVAMYPEHAEEPGLLLQKADLALQDAAASRSGTAVYAPENDRTSRESLELLAELPRAIAQRELVVFYQPKASLETGRVVSVEALVRWQHPERGLLGPFAFLPMAEQTGLIKPLTSAVLDASLAQCARWAAEGIDLAVSVNLSVLNLIDHGLPGDLAVLLDRHAVPAAKLELEITESILMADPVRAMQVLDELRELGVGLSLDDFGTGYSSLAYLKSLAVDELKIDKSFVMHMDTDDGDAVIVRSTVDLGHNLGLRVVAEGVETPEAWERLRDMGCDLAQGYLLTKPLPGDELTTWLRERDRSAMGLDLDGLLEGWPVDPVDQRLGDGA
jgi:diguanylate cyclase (GGDEF)-like protein